jgi:hypothetical protein
VRPSLKVHRHAKYPPEAIWNTGFAIVRGKLQPSDPLSFATLFRFCCGCMDQTNPRLADVAVLEDIMFHGAPCADFLIVTIQPLDPT